jgi:predicted O-methyltransferase YrrM
MSNLSAALKSVEQGDWDAGLRLLGEVADGDGSQAVEALAHRAWLKRARGDWEGALADYERYREKVPGDAAALALLAETRLISGGDPEQAFDEALEVLRLDRRNATAQRVLRAYQERFAASSETTPAAGESKLPSEMPGAFLNAAIRTLESDKAAFPGSIYPEVGRLLYAMVRAIRPKTVVETGSFIGYSTLCLAQALEDNGEGHLHCFDLFGPSHVADYVSPVIGRRETLLEYVRDHLDQAGLAHRATLRAGDSSENIRDAFAGQTEVVDFAFIDGDHTANGCAKDWNALAPLLREEALTILHDTKASGCGWLGPGMLLETLDQKARAKYRWINFPTFEGFGLGAVQRISGQTVQRWRPSLGQLLAEKLFMVKRWRS